MYNTPLQIQLTCITPPLQQTKLPRVNINCNIYITHFFKYSKYMSHFFKYVTHHVCILRTSSDFFFQISTNYYIYTRHLSK